MTEQEPAERSPCPGPHRGGILLGHARLTCPPASHRSSGDGTHHLAQQALLCSVRCRSHKHRPGGTPTAHKRETALKCAQRTFQKMQDPFSEEQPLQRPAPPSQHWLLESRGALGPSPRSPKGSPRLGSERAPAPARGARGAAGGLSPGRNPHATRTVHTLHSDSGCWSLTLWGPRCSPLRASWESRTLGASPATQRGYGQL